jgi:hypothetical protein
MVNPKPEPKPKPKSTPEQPKGPGRKRKRAAPISDWLGFIRPHQQRYRMLPRGQQKEFIEELSAKTGSSVNTLLRFIAAADLLETYGIVALPPGRGQMPVASVEAIGRISNYDFARGRDLLNGLLNGVGTIRSIKDELKNMPPLGKKSRPERSKAPRSDRDIRDVIERFVGGNREWRKVLPPKLPLREFGEWPGPTTIFAKSARPRFVVPLLVGRWVAVFDESALSWAAMPMRVHQEFLRNIAVAVTMFDYVIVYCDALQSDVARVVNATREPCRARILVRPSRTEQ